MFATTASEGRAGRVSERRTINTGRNLPVAFAVGAGLGALVIVTLLTMKITFLILVAVIVGMALAELHHVLANTRQIRLPLIPVAVGGAVMFGLAYWQGPRDVLAALAITFIAVLAWRLPGGASGYVRDITAGIFALIYLPTLASFVALMLAQPHCARRERPAGIPAGCSVAPGHYPGTH